MIDRLVYFGSVLVFVFGFFSLLALLADWVESWDRKERLSDWVETWYPDDKEED
jgi:hypothetical protein